MKIYASRQRKVADFVGTDLWIKVMNPDNSNYTSYIKLLKEVKSLDDCEDWIGYEFQSIPEWEINSWINGEVIISKRMKLKDVADKSYFDGLVYLNECFTDEEIMELIRSNKEQ